MATHIFNTERSAKARPDYRQPLKSGKYTIKLYVNIDGDRKDFSLKTSVTREEWEKMKGERVRDKVLRKKKTMIREKEQLANDIIKELGDDFSYSRFRAIMFDKVESEAINPNDVYGAIDIKISQLDPDQDGTIQLYEQTKQSLRAYSPTLKFKDITVSFLKGYEKWMIQTNGCSKTTVGMRLRNLRHIVNMAKEAKIIKDEDYPFGSESKGKYEIPTGKGNHTPLEVKDVTKILQHKPEIKKRHIGLAWGHAMWCLCFYCNGANMFDIFNMRNSELQGDFWRFYRRKTIRTRKVAEQIEIFLTPQAKEIIAQWRSESTGDDDYVFDIFNHTMDTKTKRRICNQKVKVINENIQLIGKQLGIKTHITTYVARHTWATFMDHNRVSLQYISKGLGHSSLLTTQKYLSDLNKEQKKEVADLLSGLTEPKVKKKSEPTQPMA